MSLILLSNDPSEAAGVVGSKQNIYKPWSFRNSLTETITIPKDSEVALTSCKIALDGQINIEPEAKVFYIYTGELLSGAADTMKNKSTSIPVRCELFPGITETVQTNAEGLAQEISRVLRRNIMHPAFVQELEDPEKETRVEVLRDGDGDFIGFTFTIEHLTDKQVQDSKLLTSLDPEDGVVRTTLIQNRCATDWFNQGFRRNPTQRKYNVELQGTNIRLTPKVNTNPGSSGTFTIPMVTTFFHVANNKPIANAQGIVEFDLTNVMSPSRPNPGVDNKNIPWIVGLSRCCETGQLRTNARPGPPFFQWDQSLIDEPETALNKILRGFCDYAVVNDGRVLRLMNTNCWGGAPLRDGRGGNLQSFRWQEVDYTEGGTNANFPAPYDTVTNGGDINKIQFVLDGNQVGISLVTNLGTTVDFWKYSTTRITAGTPRLINEQCKPLDISCQDLQPVMGIYNRQWPTIVDGTFDADDFYIELSKHDSFESASDYTMILPEYEASDTLRMAYYNHFLQSDRLRFRGAMAELNLRNTVTQPEEDKYGIFDATTDGFVKCLQPVLITSPSSRYTTTTQANTMRLFGMVGLNGVASGEPPWIDDGASGDDRYVYRLLSSEVPKSLSTKSIFVRLENFAQTSVNAGNGNKSSIIAHLPRFDGQNQTGRLFFEPKNLMYLDLKNVSDLKVNSFDVSFVYADESYCTSLVGTSNVVLHIRPKKSV